MSFLVGLALRNLGRNLKRTVITSVAVVAGVALMILGFGFVDGLDENVIRANINTTSGHVLLRAPGVDPTATSFPTADLRPLPPQLEQALGAGAWAPRVLFDVTLMHGQDALRARGVGYDPARDPQVFDRTRWEVEGALPEAEGVVLGNNLARMLGVKAGDVVFAQVRTAQGAINALALPVAAVATTRVPALDNAGALMPMPQALALVQAQGPTLVAVRLDDRDAALPEAARLRAAAGDWQVYTWQDEVRDMLEINQIRRRAITLVVFMIMAIAATGIANTVIMAAYERVREVGTLAALGMPPAQLRLLFLLEGGFMGLGAALLGVALGGAGTAYWSKNGIDLTQQIESAGSTIPIETVLYAHFEVAPLLWGLGFGLGVALLSSLFPAWHASRLNPADAVRAD